MTTGQDNLLISLPFSERTDFAQSSRYFWDSRRRGKEQFVIIQHTHSGIGMFELDGMHLPVPPEHAFIAVVPEASSYYYPREATEPWVFSWINFYGNLGLSLAREFRKTFGPVVPLPHRSPAGRIYHSLVGTESRMAPDRHATSVACYDFLMQWARQLSEPSQRRGDPVDLALEICASRFREPLGVKELAAASGLTREHFTRIFVARTGRSPARYLRDLRVRAAREMLGRGDAPPVREVALRCGFPSVRSLRAALVAEG